ncbi:MAG TPA: hypothetical protein VKG44_08730 [Candidatus Baltobacteraceae bacterium]|nr:hypothetical protein [Candidatus Baltobacteraceae bacterium]
MVFLGLTTPFGIAAHLISELAGLGWHDDADVVLSARHGYLALFALASLAGFVAVLYAYPRAQRRARVAALVDALPFRGRGAGFFAVSFLAQFGFFAVSQLGEGCPLCGGDVVTGLLAAGIAAALGAMVVSLGKRRILGIALALVQYLSAKPSGASVATRAGRRRTSRARGTRRTPFSFRYRPPPQAAVLNFG